MDRNILSKCVIALSVFALCGPGLYAREIAQEEMRKVEFSPPMDISGGTVNGISSLDLGDLDGDGKLDLVVIEGGMHAKGKSFAWFQAPAASGDAWTRHDFKHAAPLKRFLGSARLGDVDGDGDLDLVLSSDLHSGDTMLADVLVLLNPRPGRSIDDQWDFHYVARDLSFHHINDMEVADMDQDGKLDVVVRSLVPNEIHIFFQDRPDAWARKSIPTLLEQSEGLAVGRLNDDDLPDITFTGYVLRAPARPREEDYVRIPVDADYARVNQNTKEALGDIDGDGRFDLLLSPAEAYRGGKPHDLAWYHNPGGDLSATWEKHVILSHTNNTHTVKLARVNGDPSLDVITGAAWDPRSIRIYYNFGDGNFTPPQIISDVNGLYSGIAADFDGDGDCDIIGQETYASDSHPWLYENLLRTEQ